MVLPYNIQADVYDVRLDLRGRLVSNEKGAEEHWLIASLAAKKLKIFCQTT